MKKEFPIHVFMAYNPKTGTLKVKDDAPPQIRKVLKFDYTKDSKEGVERERVIFRAVSSSYKRTHKQPSHIAWKIMTGEWPAKIIKFIDGDRKNLKWENLRQVGSDD